MGFSPHKKGRKTFFSDIATTEEVVVFYESKHRILKTLADLGVAFQTAETPDRPLMLARELTNQFETFYRGTVLQIQEQLAASKTLGEFVVVVGPKKWK